MKQLLISQGKVHLEEVPAPVITAAHILVEVAYSLISTGTEVSSIENSSKSILKRAVDRPGKVIQVAQNVRTVGLRQTITKVQGQLNAGAPTGYSCSGIVVQVGDDITDIRPGDFVACAGAGLANHAERVLVPRNLVIKIPDGCSLHDAASMTVGSIAMQGVRRADPRLGEIVAVIGLGLLGQITVQLLKAAGCYVIGVDIDNRRVNHAKQLGVDFVFNPNEVNIKNEINQFTSNFGVDATIITAASSSNAIAQQAMEITRKKGRVVVVGAVGLSLSRSPFYEKEIDFLISSSYGPGRYDEKYERKGQDYPYAFVRWTENRNMAEYLQLVAMGKVRLGAVLEKEYDFEQAQQAYSELVNGVEKPLGIILRYKAADGRASISRQDTRVVLRSHKSGDKIRVAIIGAGSFAKSMHLPNLLRLGDLYHIRAIVDPIGSNAKATAQQFGADYASSQIEDVIKDREVDAVIITTRHNLHAIQAQEAAKAGKAVLVEKPMAMNHQELDQLVDTLRETGVPYMVGFNRRFSPAAQMVKEVVQSRRNPMLMVYRVNAGYIPPDHWTQGEEGGGRVIGEACHMFDLFQYFVGDSPVEEVTAAAITPRTEHILSSDNISATIRYGDGSVATLVYTGLGCSELPKEYIEVYVDGKILIIDDFKSLRILGLKGKGWSSPVQDKGHLNELRILADYFCGKGLDPISLDSLISTTKMSFAVAGKRD